MKSWTAAPRSLTERVGSEALALSRFSAPLWFTWTLGLTALFTWIAAIDLENFRPVSNDDVWIMSASYKLAMQGVFGSDLYAGFFHADRHYFIALPVHHILQASSFRVLGAGVAQARLVSLIGAVLLLWAVSWLAYRWYGLAVALLTGVFLVFWRSDLIATWPGLPLLTVARSGRYDVGAVAWSWLALLFLDRLMWRSGRLTALTVGLCSGLAALPQFFGAAALPLVSLAWLWHRGKRALKETTTYWIVTGVLVVLLPYGLYVASHFADFLGQSSLKEGRTDFGNPGFYLTNVSREPERFAAFWHRPLPRLPLVDAFSRPASPWLLVAGIGPALLYLGARSRRAGMMHDRLLGLCLIVTAGFLALADQTKAPVYAIILLPPLCLTLALGWVGTLRAAWEQGWWLPLRLALAGVSVGLLAIIARESRAAYQIDLRQSGEVSRYLDVGRGIDAHLTPGARVLGADRWWWALRDHPYRSLNSVWPQWRIAREQGKRLPELSDWIHQIQPDFIVVSNDVRRMYPDELQNQYLSFLQRCALLVGAWTDRTYGPIEIYRLPKAASGLFVCQS